MGIRYDYKKDIDKVSLQELFLSVEWDLGNYPEKLQEAIWNSHRVVSAWDGDKLIGLINSLADDVMNVYIPYLLVRPEHQKRGIGKRLVEVILQEYKDYARKVLISDYNQIAFYKKCGFEVFEGTLPMLIT